MTKTKKIFDIVLSRYADPAYQPPRALLERPNTIVFPALQERDEPTLNQNAAMAYTQQPLLEMPMMDGMGMGGMGMGGGMSAETGMQTPLFPEGEEFLP